MLALALELRSKGHSVRFCVPPDGLEMLSAHHFEAHPMGLDIRHFVTTNASLAADNPIGTFKSILTQINIAIEDHMTVLAPHLEWADILLGSALTFGAPTAAQIAGVPYRLVVLCPQLIPSSQHPPMAIPSQNLSGGINRILWWGQNQIFHRVSHRVLNRKRREHGLDAVRSAYQHFVDPEKIILAVDPTFAPCPDNIQVTQTGFWLLPPTGDIDSDLSEYIERGPTIFIGFGSMPDPDPAATTRMIFQAVKDLHCQVLLQRGWAGLGDESAPPNCRVIGPTKHGVLFPRLHGVVHHGGSGTTATAARAGIPQMVVPHLMDQFYWGQKIKEAKVGPAPIRRSKLTAESFAESLNVLLSDAHRSAARALASKLNAYNALERGVAAVEQAVKNEPTQAA
jgi:vancomycin aglycone glucosyltransferase